MSCIIRKGNKMIAVLLTICFMCVTLSKQIYAAGHIASISIPVSQTLTIHGQTQNQYQSTYQLKALDNDCPMPEDSQNNNYYFTMNNNDQTNIDIQFTHAGIFSYQLSQIIDDSNNQMTYDDTKYQLDVYVKNTSHGGLIASVIAYLENGNKTGEIQFNNELNIQTLPGDGSQTNDNDNTTPPDIEVPTDETVGTTGTTGTTTRVTQGGGTGTAVRGQTNVTSGETNPDNNQNTGDEEQDAPVNSQIGENQLPLAGTIDHWALMNLICTILTVVLAIINLLWKHQKEDEEDNTLTTRRRWIKVAGAIIAVVSVIAFVLTEDLTLPMTMVDQWTILMVILLIVNIVVFVVNSVWKKTETNE